MQCLVLSMRTGSGMSHLQFQQLLPWAAVPVCVAFVAHVSVAMSTEDGPIIPPAPTLCVRPVPLTSTVKLLSLQVERWSRSAFVMRGYTVTALRDAAPHKDWFTELMGTCAQHMAMLERSESHSAAGAHGDLAAKKPPHIAHTCTHTPWSCWGILKLRTTTLAPRYIFESATKCVRVVGMWWWGISAGVPLCENVREHPESQKSWLEQLAEMKHSTFFASDLLVFIDFAFSLLLFPILLDPLRLEGQNWQFRKFYKVCLGICLYESAQAQTAEAAFSYCGISPFAVVLMESWRCLQLDVAWTETVKVQQTGTQKLQQD